MFCTCVGCIEVETRHLIVPDMDSSQNGPIEVLI